MCKRGHLTDPVYPPYLPRLAERHLEAVISVQPVAVIMGARQAGKSTLVRQSPVLSDHRYLTLDSLEVRAQALEDPEGLAGRAEHLILDEVQRAPDLLLAIKAAVDAEPRRPGHFVLTGSANLLAMKQVEETLAGRASYVTLWPLTRRERLGFGAAGCWTELVDSPAAHWTDIIEAQTAPMDDWRDCVCRSGYPSVVSAALDPAQQADWLQGYLDAYVERDIAELSQISRPLDLLRLMRAAAGQVGQVEHQVTWARATGLPASTVSRWTDLLEISYQLIRVPAFSVNRTKRLARSPKVFWSDVAMALHLAGLREPTGHHLENMVLNDLLPWAWSRSPRPAVMHWRTTAQDEVDFVVELPSGGLLPIEVKAAAQPGWGDVAGLRSFLAEYEDVTLGGLVLHGGEATYRLGPKLVAAPWWKVI